MNQRIREVVEFEIHFSEFLKKQPVKVQNKIFKIIEAIETLERVPSNYIILPIASQIHFRKFVFVEFSLIPNKKLIRHNILSHIFTIFGTK
jgi:hypothetical protein